MDSDFFDNPTVKKGIAVMFWLLAIFPITKNCQTFGRWIPEHLDSQLPSMHQLEEQRIIAIRTIRNAFFDYWIVKKKYSLSSSH